MPDGIWLHDVMVARFQDAGVTTDRPPSHGDGGTDDSQASRTCIPPAGGGGGKGGGDGPIENEPKKADKHIQYRPPPPLPPTLSCISQLRISLRAGQSVWEMTREKGKKLENCPGENFDNLGNAVVGVHSPAFKDCPYPRTANKPS